MQQCITPLLVWKDLKVKSWPESGPSLAPIAVKLGIRRDLEQRDRR